MESLPRSLSQYDPIFLLWCDEPFGITSIDEVSKALLRSADPEDDIGALLREADWRCHLVAGVALVVSELRTKPKLVEALWGAVDAGSWVSPQLGVCLAIIDADFSLRAKARIESGCPVVVRPSTTSAEVAARRHDEQGPDGSVERSAKTLAALLYLCSLRPECEPWLIPCRADRSTQRLLALDSHHGDKIAEVWRTKFNRALSAFQSS